MCLLQTQDANQQYHQSQKQSATFVLSQSDQLTHTPQSSVHHLKRKKGHKTHLHDLSHLEQHPVPL